MQIDAPTKLMNTPKSGTAHATNAVEQTSQNLNRFCRREYLRAKRA